jgi:phosphoadenosine phosphosulfate reductase
MDYPREIFRGRAVLSRFHSFVQTIIKSDTNMQDTQTDHSLTSAEEKAMTCPCGKIGPCSSSLPKSDVGQAEPTPATTPNQGPSLPDPTGEDADTYGDLEAQTPDTDSAEEILHRAASRDDWDNAYALVSGGKDSTAALHYTYYNAPFNLDGIVYIDTNIGLVEVKEYVKDLGERFDLPVYIADTHREEDTYQERINSYGFPGANKESHRWEYINNKDKPLSKLITSMDGRPLFVSGARRFESQSRYESVAANGIEEKDRATYVSPLARYSDSDVDNYLERNNVELCETVDLLESSGDCLCGAYATRFLELNQLRENFRYAFTYIQSLEAQVIDAARQGEMKREAYEEFTLWGHGSYTSRELADIQDSNQMDLCQSCEPAVTGLSADTYQTLTEAALRSDRFDISDTPTAFRDRFDVTQAIPEDANESELAILRRAYTALNDAATKAGFDSLDSMIENAAASSERDRKIVEEYVDENYPDMSVDEQEKLITALREKGVIK